MNRRHPGDDKLLARLLGEPVATTDEHMSRCERCRAEEARVRRALVTYRAAVVAETERPSIATSAQEPDPRRFAPVNAAAALARRRPAWPLAWGVAPAAVALALGLVAGYRLDTGREVSVDDHGLLVDVQRSIEQNVPIALAPALLLTTAMTEPSDGSVASRTGRRR